MATLTSLLARLRPAKRYARRPALILVNGLAEQPESWFRNKRYWSRTFDVYAPNILVFDGEVVQGMIASKQRITVDFLVERLHTFLTQFVQSPPYHFVASSLGGKVVVEFAVKYPELVNRIVLLCPSGMGDEEKLPIMDGIRGGEDKMPDIVRSVFNNKLAIDRGLVTFYKKAIANRRWRRGIVSTTNGTLEHVVRGKLKSVAAPTLFVTASEDKICDPKTAEEAAKELPNGLFVSVPGCGHAPQIERHWFINRLVRHFLTTRNPTNRVPRLTQLLLAKPTRAAK